MSFGALLAKELRVELRTREMLTGGVLLVLLVVVLSNLAWSHLGRTSDVAPGVLWIAFSFAATLILNRSIHRERDRGTWDALVLLPVDWGVVYLAKTAAHAIILLVVAALTLPLYAVLFDADLLPFLPGLALVIGLATVGLSAAGTLVAIASMHGRAREILLPVLLFPVLVPLFIVAIQATQRVLLGHGFAELTNEILFVSAYDTIFLAIGWLAVDYLLGD